MGPRSVSAALRLLLRHRMLSGFLLDLHLACIGCSPDMLWTSTRGVEVLLLYPHVYAPPLAVSRLVNGLVKGLECMVSFFADGHRDVLLIYGSMLYG